MIDPSPEIQDQRRKLFMRELADYRKDKLPNYHVTKPGFPIAQRERCLRELTEDAATLTLESKIILLRAVKDSMPQYLTYWIFASLGGDTTDPAQKQELLVELNRECDRQTNRTVREHLPDWRDKDFLRDITMGVERHKDTVGSFVG